MVKKMRDYIEYRYLIAEEELSVRLYRPDAGELELTIEKYLDEDLGIGFVSDVFDKGAHPLPVSVLFCGTASTGVAQVALHER